MAYKIEKYQTTHLSSLTELLDDAFKIENKDKVGLVKWKYFHPSHPGKTITYIALDDAKVIAHYANIPLRVVRANHLYKTAVCTDMATHTLYRGLGLITRLSEKVYKDIDTQGFDFSIGFSNDAGIKVDKNSKNYGYVIVGRFVRYFKIVVTRKKILLHLEKTEVFSKSFRSNSSGDYFMVNKSYEYLMWRYILKPSKEYSIYQIYKEKELIGYVVLRFVGYKCYVYDIITDVYEKKNMIAILRSIENKALDHNVRIIIYNVLDNKFWRDLFTRYKYLRRISNQINYFLTIKIHNASLPKDIILSKENWFLMNGDIL